IEAGSILVWNPPGRIGIARPGQGTYVSSDHVQKVVEQEAWKEDNRRKLGARNSVESHLFILVDHARFDAWMGLTEDVPPSQPPSLPPEITDIWVATSINKMY